MYAKIFTSLFDGSMRGHSDLILVFVNLLCHADQDGIVDRHWKAVSDETGLSVETVKVALKSLEGPDIESRSRNDEGQRIRLLDESREWGWQIINFAHYRDMRTAEERREYMREYMKNTRKNKNVNNVLTPVNTCKQNVNTLANADIYVDTDTDTDTEDNAHALHDAMHDELTWKTSFQVYQQSEQSAYNQLLNDGAWMTEKERLNPGIDVRLSLEKAHLEFWNTEAGWKHKKAKRSKDIDWKATFTSAIGRNKVWLRKDRDGKFIKPATIEKPAGWKEDQEFRAEMAKYRREHPECKQVQKKPFDISTLIN